MPESKKPLVLIVGTLGGLGANLAIETLKLNCSVLGIDNFNPMSAPEQHHKFVLGKLQSNPDFQFLPLDIRRYDDFASLVNSVKPTCILFAIPQIPNSILSRKHSSIAEEDIDIERLYQTTLNTDLYVFERDDLLSLSSCHPGLVRWKNFLNDLDLDEPAFLLKFPLLLGPYISPYSFPMNLIYQKISKMEIFSSTELPDHIQLANIQKIAERIIESVVMPSDQTREWFLNDGVLELPDHLIMQVKAEDLVDAVHRDSPVQPDGDDNFSELTFSISDWFATLPYLPPEDWQEKIKKKKKKPEVS
ncbi:hypothetical protein K8I28_03025 [bacterium]|nr:hypothetical protein [bacterium]